MSFEGFVVLYLLSICRADGLTLPFALAAGISGALQTALVGSLAAGGAHLIAKFIA